MDTNDKLKAVVHELAEANEALLRVVSDADSELAAELLSRVTLLERRRNRLVRRNTQSMHGRLGEGSYKSVVPLRDQVIRALHLLSSPATGRLLADVTKARWEDRIETVKLSSLRRDESRSWAAGQDVKRRTALREVYVVPALSYDRFAPVRGTLALSSWQVSRRLIAPLSPRVDMLKITIALAREAGCLSDTGQREAMQRMVGRLGASIPGVQPFGATTREVIAAAEAELTQIEDIDFRERAAAANRAAEQLDPDALLFGAPLRSIQTAKSRGLR